MAELLGIERLRQKLAGKRTRVQLRYTYYEMKNAVHDFNITIPKEWAWLSAVLGWCAKSVDALADRLVFREFDHDDFALNEIYQMNSQDILADSTILSALISSCCFIYVSLDESGYPRFQVIDGGNATGVLDPITNLLTEGYAVLDRDPESNSPTLEAYFTADQTVYYPRGGASYAIENPAPYPLLVPVIHRPDARRVFGRSRITRACMSIQQAALRTMKRSEISAEFYSFPQKYVVGLAQDAEFNNFSATISSFLAFTTDENGQHPILGQFQQQSMTPFADQLRMLAALFAGETGLTMDDLGFVTDNPSSAESIKASHETLRLMARKAQRDFSVGFLNAGYLAACVRDDFPYLRRQLYMTRPKWEPIFEPDAGMLSSIGDGAIKLNQAVPGYFGKENLRDLTGVEADET